MKLMIVMVVVMAILQTVIPQGRQREESADQYSQASKLINQLINKSDRKVRPNPYGDPAKIMVDLFVASFGSINAANMDYTISIYLTQRWVDERMTFKKGTNESVDEPVVISSFNLENIWIPDIYFPDEKEGSFHKVTISNQLMQCYPNGTIIYRARLTLRLSCPMDLTHFPMDHQQCHIKISCYSYDKKQVILDWLNDNPVDMDMDELSLPQFKLQDTTIDSCSQKFTTGDYSCLKATFHLKRQIGYYVLQSYIPSILIVTLSWVSFWIDRDAAPARISLGVTTVLTMTTQLASSTGVSMNISYPKALDVWYAFCMLLVFGSMVEYALVNSLRRKELRERRRCAAGQPLQGSPTKDGGFQNDGLQRGDFQVDEEPPKPGVIGKCTYSFAECIGKCLKIKDPPLSSAWLDKFCRCLFPGTFLAFNCVYWIIYTTFRFSAVH